MKAGSLIGFTEAELALILLVVFAVVLPMKRNEAPVAQAGSVVTASDSLRITQDSLRSLRDLLTAERTALGKARDSLAASFRENASLLKARGELRSTADPLCSALQDRREPAQPFGPIRIYANAYEFNGRFLTIEQLAAEIRDHTDRSAQLRCRYVMRVSYSSQLPAGRIKAFRDSFTPRYYIRDSVNN